MLARSRFQRDDLIARQSYAKITEPCELGQKHNVRSESIFDYLGRPFRDSERCDGLPRNEGIGADLAEFRGGDFRGKVRDTPADQFRRFRKRVVRLPLKK